MKEGKKPKDSEAFLSKMRDRFQLAYDREQNNRVEMYDDIKFSYGGEHQWDDKTYRARIADSRPALTVNRIKAPIRQISNDIRQNKPAIKVSPVDDQSDKETAKIYEGLIRHIEVKSMATVAYQCAVDGAIKCGYGAFEIRNQYNNDDSFDQDIVIKRILNQFSVYFDPSAKEITKEDGRYAFLTEMITEEAFKDKYPNAEISSFEGGDDTYDLWYNDQVRIARYYVKEPVTKVLVQFDDGSVSEQTEDQVKTGLLDQMGIKRKRTVKTHKVMCYIVSGSEVLEPPYEVPSKFIPLIPVIGEETIVDGELKLSGIVRDAKDPQRLYNYWRTTAAETIALQPKAPWLVTPKMVEGLTGQWSVANKANLPYLMYKHDEQAGRPVREPPPTPPVAMWQESEIAGNDIKFTTGVFDSGLGNVGPEQSGRAILARQQKTELANFIYSDNLTIAMTHAGKVLIDMIPKVYDTERVIRVLNPDDTEEITQINKVLPNGEKINDITVGKYDVVVKPGPSYQTRRAEAADSMMAYMQAVPQVGANIADLVAKNMDWPGADDVAKRARKMIPQELLEGELDEEELKQQQTLREAQQPMLDLQQELMQAELDGKVAKTTLDYAKAKETMASIDRGELDNLLRVLQTTGGNTGMK